MKQKGSILKISLILMGFAFIFTSCKKDKEEVETPTGNVPTLTTINVNSITQTSAMCGGEISSDGGSTVTGRGVCWSTGQTPTISDSKTMDGNGAGSFTSTIIGLTSNTTYYVRAYATNSNGTGYGPAISFKTRVSGGSIINDVDGNAYHVQFIGNQVWLQENLKVTKLNDGTPIPKITDGTSWTNATSFSYCWYDNNEALNKDIYGALYNWYTVNTNKLCPSGWHIPSDAEWNTLIDYLGGESVAGSALKETGTTHWLSPNTDATNSTNFTALPGGYRYGADFGDIGHLGVWWSTTPSDEPNSAWVRTMNEYDGEVGRSGLWNYKKGVSVRCIED